MNHDISIEVNDLTVKYKALAPYSIKKNLLHLKRRNPECKVALNQLNFTINKGEIIGVIGENGSGKSTLLKTISGVFSPDEGTVNLYGNSVALSAIGVGFKGELTGRENIFLSGMLLGFSHRELLDKQNDIIEFSDLNKAIDQPVRTYSSGMYSKLAFSITSNLDTDILLIDEVLSVGDQRFRKKSKHKMMQLITCDERTVLIVSHNMNMIKELCTRVIWLHDGRIKMFDNTATVVATYLNYMR